MADKIQTKITITVHEACDDETGRTTYMVTDDGGEFDDAEHSAVTAAHEDVEDRAHHYRGDRGGGPSVAVVAPEGRGF
jgi:hypothetical protein